MTNTIHESLYFKRYFGYQKMMMMVGLLALPSVVLEYPEDYLSSRKMSKGNEATALMAVDNIFTLRTMQSVQTYGYVIPETLPVVSFGNSIFSTLTHPCLMSIDINIFELRRVAVQKPCELTREGSNSGVCLIVPRRLIKRETVVPLENPY